MDAADAITTTLDDGQVITAGPAALAVHGGHDSDHRGSGHHDQRDSRVSEDGFAARAGVAFPLEK